MESLLYVKCYGKSIKYVNWSAVILSIGLTHHDLFVGGTECVLKIRSKFSELQNFSSAR